MQCTTPDTDLDRATSNVGALKLYNGIGCTFVSVEPDKTKDDVSLGFCNRYESRNVIVLLYKGKSAVCLHFDLLYNTELSKNWRNLFLGESRREVSNINGCDIGRCLSYNSLDRQYLARYWGGGSSLA
jgi:hypothetical protein